jgi:serine O-acetyltransferase
MVAVILRPRRSLSRVRPGYAPGGVFKSDNPAANAFMREIRARHPGLRHALVADARVALLHRGERHELQPGRDTIIQILRLCWASDAFLAQSLYRVRAALQRRGVPVLPRILHRLAIMSAGVTIGDPVVIQPGMHLLHGQVVIDGIVEIRSGVVIGPFVTIGLRKGDVGGPTIEEDVRIGTGAKVLGRIRVGAGASIAANAVVIEDVPAGATGVGAPAGSHR